MAAGRRVVRPQAAGDGHHTFPKGHPRYGGRPKGRQNRFGGDLREAVVLGIQAVGFMEKDKKGSKHGKGGVQGFIEWLALNAPKTYLGHRTGHAAAFFDHLAIGHGVILPLLYSVSLYDVTPENGTARLDVARTAVVLMARLRVYRVRSMSAGVSRRTVQRQ
jgi:hypothetical protein